MEYRLERELQPDSLLMAADRERLVFDQVTFGVPPRDSFRLELQKELREIAAREAPVNAPHLLKYRGMEKYRNELYLVRDAKYLDVKASVNLTPEEAVVALREILAILKCYHQAGLTVGGFSPGLLKQDQAGRLLLQDPLMMNRLAKLLDPSYRFDAPAEVIQGASWSEKADIFSWGALAYRLLTGTDPFAAPTPEERMEKIIRIGPAPPRSIQPRLSENFSRLLLDCLSVRPEKRPSLESLETFFQKPEADGTPFFVSAAAAAEYAEKARGSLQRQQMKEGVWFWLRRYGIAVGVTLAVLIFFISTTFFSRPKKTITPETKPDQVLAYYFQALRRLDVTLLDEAVHKAKNTFDSMVTNLYVINRTQQGVTQNMRDYIKVTVEPQIRLLSQTPAQRKYRVAYTVKVAFDTRDEYFERQDIMRLRPVNRVWRITEIQVLQSRHRTVQHPKAEPATSPLPAVSPGPG